MKEQIRKKKTYFSETVCPRNGRTSKTRTIGTVADLTWKRNNSTESLT